MQSVCIGFVDFQRCCGWPFLVAGPGGEGRMQGASCGTGCPLRGTGAWRRFPLGWRLSPRGDGELAVHPCWSQGLGSPLSAGPGQGVGTGPAKSSAIRTWGRRPGGQFPSASRQVASTVLVFGLRAPCVLGPAPRRADTCPVPGRVHPPRPPGSPCVLVLGSCSPQRPAVTRAPREGSPRASGVRCRYGKASEGHVPFPVLSPRGRRRDDPAFFQASL